MTHDEQAGSGVVTIVIDGAGDNTIIVISGAEPAMPRVEAVAQLIAASWRDDP